MRYNRNYILTLMFSLLIFDAYADEPKVCFYMDDNYNGESLCATQGNSVADIPDQWNDRISSISVPHGLIVTVYGDINFAGASRTFEADVDLVSDKSLMYLNDNISSFEIKKAVCFYGESNFTGDSVCLSGGEEIDLYRGGYSERKKSHLLNTLNDDVYSIKIPPGMQATVYEDDNYNGNYFVLTEDYTSDDLLIIRMNNKISSARVNQSDNFICDRFCSVKKSMYFKIQEFFGSYWSDPRIKYRDVLIDFQLSDTDNYSIKFFDHGVASVNNYKLFFYDGDKNYDEGFIFNLDRKSSNLSFLLRFNGGFFKFNLLNH